MPDDTIPPINVTLLGMDTITLQSYIEGKWKVVYAKGGITGNTMWYPDMWVEFTDEKQYIEGWPTLGYIYEPEDYYFEQYPHVHPVYGYVFMLVFLYRDDCIPYEIRNDTLIYRNRAADGFFYHCVKF